MRQIVFDLECDGLNPTKIWCLSYQEDGVIHTLTSYNEMRLLLASVDVLIGHNITLFDIPVLEKILGVEVRAKLIDTLPLSWYLYPNNIRHGLEIWGEFFGVSKPVIDNWEDQTLEEYIHRCEEDVKINTKLWKKMQSYLLKIYGEDPYTNLIDYLSFKMDCVREQERSGWKLNREYVKRSLDILEKGKQEKVEGLAKAMPKRPVVVKRTRPAKPYKKDGTLSATGERWFSLLKEKGYPPNYQGEIEVVKDMVEGNPNSPPQIKDWLYSLGWMPTTFKYVKDGWDTRKIPQINLDFGAGICNSIKILFDREPALKLLDGLSVLSHRIAILKGFLKNVDKDGYLKAQVRGLTNTLRFKHATLVNLPGVGATYGNIIRGCLIAPEGYELCGSDMSSLEDRTKQHYMFLHDPKYVEEMNKPDFDPHLDIALQANIMTSEQILLYKGGDGPTVKQFKPVRHQAKTANYAATYGASASTIAIQAGISKAAAEVLVEAYWKRNWSIKTIAEQCEVKTVDGQKWLYNPVSRIWYSLRSEKDRFSTLNQGTGSFCFDMWVKNIRSKRPQLTGQFHDEVILTVRKGFREEATRLLKWAIEKTNEQLKLNRSLDVDVQFGDRYSDIH